MSRVIPSFGAKGRLAVLYSPPHFDVVIEPFALGAHYSLRHRERDVWLNDLDPRTYDLWAFVLSSTACDWIEDHFPTQVFQGDHLSQLIDVTTAPTGLVELIRAWIAPATYGSKGVHTIVTKWGVHRSWARHKRHLLWLLPQIAHWQITNVSYEELPDVEACWFVDPPYPCAAGERYAYGPGDIDFAHLARWCRSRRGQVIVTANADAEFLPMRRLTIGSVGPAYRKQLGTAEGVYQSCRCTRCDGGLTV